MPPAPPPPQRAKRQRKTKRGASPDEAASPSRAMPPRVTPADVDDDDETRKLLAIHITREREGIVLVGAATLQGESMLVLGRTVAWMGDVPFILQLVIEWTKPLARVFMSSKTDEWITDAVQSALKEGGVCPFSFQASGTFDFEHGVQRLRAALDDDKRQAIGSLLDISNCASVGAIGGVLVAAHKQSASINVTSVDLFDLGSFMLMDSASMRALDITRLEEHPSVIRGRGRPKEGFSLLTLLNRARTSTGATLVRRWLSRPLTNLQVRRPLHIHSCVGAHGTNNGAGGHRTLQRATTPLPCCWPSKSCAWPLPKASRVCTTCRAPCCASRRARRMRPIGFALPSHW